MRKDERVYWLRSVYACERDIDTIKNFYFEQTSQLIQFTIPICHKYSTFYIIYLLYFSSYLLFLLRLLIFQFSAHKFFLTASSFQQTCCHKHICTYLQYIARLCKQLTFINTKLKFSLSWYKLRITMISYHTHHPTNHTTFK